MHFHKVDAGRSQASDRFSRFLCGSHDPPIRCGRTVAVQFGACGYNSWTNKIARLDFSPPPLNFSKLAPHVARGSHAERDQQGKRCLGGLRQMNMHVPEPRDEKSSTAVDDASTRGASVR